MKPIYFVCAVFSALLIWDNAEARSYNCADQSSRPDGKWSLDETLSRQVVGDIESNGLGKPKHFKYRFCGSIENGEQMIMVGTLEIVDGKPVCDSSANFAVFYDPRKRSFGEIIPSVNMCMPATTSPPSNAASGTTPSATP